MSLVNRATPVAGGKRPYSINAKLFFAVTVIEVVVNCALEAYIFGQYSVNVRLSNRVARTVPTYLSIFIAAFLFQSVLAFIALRQRNTIQIFGLTLFNLTFLAYSIVQIEEIHSAIMDSAGSQFLKDGVNGADLWDDLKPFLIVIPVVVFVGQVCYFYLAWRLYKDFGWEIFKTLGADRRIRRLYKAYQIFVCLLQFDFFFFLGFTMQLLVLNVPGVHDYELYVTVAALPITFVFLLCVVWFTKREFHAGILLFDVGLFAACAYFIFKLYRIYDEGTKASYSHDRISLTTFAVISVVLMVITFVNSIICEVNFGKGLR
ncbi:hypothetical protein SAICODRAFT_77792, partial [Saitoella complicata NRRL Y-17804]|uniref:uncharacterized protein n=1 Tax=Saitoella complicata (strain BCRC 22490 / CBS 7301 / JCM 7358 / NBRC 10748 / NRRL Y-17804) TaxID=698492 RepID=UPI00086693D9